MTIGTRLNLCMQITGTTNSALSKVLNFDASYISRIRSGKRGIPLRQPFAGPAAAYFARQIRKDPALKRAASEMILQGIPWPETEEEAAEYIRKWLLQDEDPADAKAAAFSSSIGEGDEGSREEAEETGGSRPAEASGFPVPAGGIRCFYGNEGKREAVEQFLRRLLLKPGPHLLLLHSDENMDWLTEDPAFGERWAALLAELLKGGSRIRIIHSVRREIGEMLEAVRKWLPLYMTGGIESFYLPKIRDGILRRTLFTADGEIAVVSSSVGEAAEGMLNLLVENRQAAKALEKEFTELFAFCRPLLSVILPQDEEKRKEVLESIKPEQPGLIIRDLPEGIRILAREECGILVQNRKEPGVSFFIREANLMETMLDYLRRNLSLR